jgi:hypothetical protein
MLCFEQANVSWIVDAAVSSAATICLEIPRVQKDNA